jgi:hypothetical protein
MPTFRLIHREASTGDRSSGLSHFGFRVWIQYQLSADDFGVCPAAAAKLQGDNEALLEEPTARVQREIEHLIEVGLVGEFLDGRRRYLYQADWQDWQRIDYPSQTSLPPVPEDLFGKLSAKTRKLFTEKHPKILQTFASHARGRGAHANADANANANADANADATDGARRPRRARADGHADHVAEFCGWCCLPAAFIDERLPRAGEGVTRDGLLTWARAVRTLWADVPVGESWAFWKARWSEATASVEPSAKERADFDQWRRAVGPNASGWTLDDYVRRRRAEEGGGLVAPRIDEFRERDAERTAS